MRKKGKLTNGKRTKTYGLVGLNGPLRQGRSLWLPTLPYQKTNRYAVVGIMLSSCIFVCVKRIVIHADLAYYVMNSR